MLQLIYLCVIVIVHMVHYAVSSPATSYVYSYEEDALFRLHIIPAVWSDAALRCQLEGGVLASPTTRVMAQAMLSTMEAHKLTSSVFIGATGILSKGYFKSVDGTDLDKTSLEWAAQEPNNANNDEDCLAMTQGGNLEDVSCSSLLPYFCRKESIKTCRVAHAKALCKSHGYKWEPQIGSCYKFHGVAKTWRDALATCHSEGASGHHQQRE
ncbi:hemolymph lipopolysaccharide-binding protein-like [Leguminivora glycinivorella]|uniref:hemolymph lipopolysaccharide-binding protein-like n=1 Tax=Leguminivora glycinivorella TaxID=1035111 RepID=UPI00200ED6C7|nr:hemolymph lipopolysaccharide-binding protein-like [Leguminivora glycinivorella]